MESPNLFPTLAEIDPTAMNPVERWHKIGLPSELARIELREIQNRQERKAYQEFSNEYYEWVIRLLRAKHAASQPGVKFSPYDQPLTDEEDSFYDGEDAYFWDIERATEYINQIGLEASRAQVDMLRFCLQTKRDEQLQEWDYQDKLDREALNP